MAASSQSKGCDYDTCSITPFVVFLLCALSIERIAQRSFAKSNNAILELRDAVRPPRSILHVR